MTCRALLTAPNGSSIEARCLLDNASSASFVSECIAQCLLLPRGFQPISISGITGSANNSTSKAVTQLSVSPVSNTERQLSISAIIVSQVTCDLPVNPVPFGLDWVHLDGLPLADPDFGLPGRIDTLLNVDVFFKHYLVVAAVAPPGLQLPLRLSSTGYLVAV